MITATSQQSLLDLAIQHAGSADNAIAIAIANGMSLTDDIEVGADIQISPATNKNITQYYAINQLQPATAVSAAEIGIQGGINYMGIEIDFIIS